MPTPARATTTGGWRTSWPLPATRRATWSCSMRQDSRRCGATTTPDFPCWPCQNNGPRILRRRRRLWRRPRRDAPKSLRSSGPPTRRIQRGWSRHGSTATPSPRWTPGRATCASSPTACRPSEMPCRPVGVSFGGQVRLEEQCQPEQPQHVAPGAGRAGAPAVDRRAPNRRALQGHGAVAGPPQPGGGPTRCGAGRRLPCRPSNGRRAYLSWTIMACSCRQAPRRGATGSWRPCTTRLPAHGWRWATPARSGSWVS